VFASLGDWRGDEGLTGFLAEHIPEVGWAAQALSDAGRLVVLLDGLNEVPTARRKTKAAEVLALKGRLPKDTPLIVSCRRDDYVGDLELGLDTLSLEPLSPQRVRATLRQWLPDNAEGVAPGSAERLFWQLAGDEEGLADVLATWLAAGATEDAFWSVSDPQDDAKAYAKTSGEADQIWRRHIPNPRSLLRLAANPSMLTMLFQVWVYEGKLPRNRGDLFARFIDCLLSREGLLVKHRDTGVWQRTADGERLLSGLTGIAWVMQGERLERGEQEQGDFGVLTVVPRATALEELGSEVLLKRAEDATLLGVARRSASDTSSCRRTSPRVPCGRAWKTHPAARRRALARAALVGAQRLGGVRRAARRVLLRRLHAGRSLACRRPARGLTTLPGKVSLPVVTRLEDLGDGDRTAPVTHALRRLSHSPTLSSRRRHPFPDLEHRPRTRLFTTSGRRHAVPMNQSQTVRHQLGVCKRRLTTGRCQPEKDDARPVIG
jgi:hypothetical protein